MSEKEILPEAGVAPDMQAEEIITPEERIIVPEKGVLRTENLVKRYGRRTVANHVSIDVTQARPSARPQRSRQDHDILYDRRAHRAQRREDIPQR